MYHLGQREVQSCAHCHSGAKQTIEHLIWDCEAFNSQRYEDVELQGITTDMIPPSLRYGVALAMGTNLQQTFWGHSTDAMDHGTAKLLGAHGFVTSYLGRRT